MKDLKNRIKMLLYERKHKNRLIALLTVFSIFVSFLVPYIEMAPGVAITQSEIQTLISGLPDMTGDSSTDVSLSVDGSNYGDSADAGEANTVSIWLQVAYGFNIQSAGVSKDQPSFYFKLSKYDVEWVNDWENLTAADSSDGWVAWRNENIGDNKYAPATYDVYRDENGEIYVIVTLNERYIDYIETQGSNQVKGNVKFSADVSRDDSQDGDKTIFDGEADLKVSFDDIDPTVNKEGGLTYQNDPTTGNPIIRWTITLNDFYELKNFALSDTHLNAMIPGTLRAVDENGQEIGISANGNNFVFDQETTTSKKITITYESVATDTELNDTSNGHKGFATNTVNLNYKDGVTSTGQVDLNADFKAHITKTGKPSYEVDGEKGYIYWTVTVSRNYKGSLDGYVVTDSIEGVDTSAMELVSVTGATVSGSAPWTISGHTPGENVVITYKTPVTKNQSSVVKNTASVTPPDGSTPDNSDPKQVIYNDTDLYTLNKTGSFDENTEKITWTITIDATKSNSLETLNGYVIEDDAFSRTDIENMTVTAWNDYGTIASGVPITNIASLTDGKYVVNSTPAYDKIEIKYTVPLTTEEIADRADLKSGETLTAKNTVKVSSDGDNPDVETLEGKTSVPSGIIGISASKNWEGYFSDNDRTYPVTITLQKRLGYNGEWTDVEAKTITSASADQKVEWNSLPKKENGESVFYRVVETVADDANYSVSYSNNNGVNYNSTIYITNTWKNMAVSVNKHWNGDSGHENDRPDEVRFELWQTYDWSEDWTNTGKYAILNTDTNDITYYNSDGTTTGVKAWSDLPRTEDGKVVYYKIVEEDVAGYTSNGGNVRQNSTGTITITNTADYFKLTANKVWDDGNYTADRSEITFDLYKSTDNATWTLHDSKTLSAKENESVSWDWLPSYDENGNALYYKIEERDVPENYTASYSNNSGIQGNPGSDQYITITNTWQMMNVSVQKNWVNISDSERPGSVELELWRRIEGQAWEKVPDLGTVTVTASDYWKKDNAWTELPKTIDVDGVTAKIYYAAREVGTSTDYISTFDTNGINNTGISTVTNKPAKLNVTANKKWNASTATLPNSITVHLEQSTDLGASWTTVADSEKTMNSDNNWGTTLEWNDLPVQDANGQEILYRVVETEVEGFNTTYSPAQISANSGNIEITNTQKASYKKYAIKPITDSAAELSSADALAWQVELLKNRVDSITADDLVLSDDGQYYIFRWYVDLSSYPQDQMGTDHVDLLPDNSSFFMDENHCVTIWWGSGGAQVYNSFYLGFSDFIVNGNTLNLNGYARAYSYFIKVPKDIVDNEIATNGKYVQTNKIKADGETEYVEADLVVTNESETGTINKKNTNDKSSTVTNSKGMAIGDTRAYYSLDVNPDALYLSSSDTVTVTDTFRILKYLDSSGEIHTGYDLLNAALENVAVYEVDNSTGKKTLLTSGYSYVISQVNDSFVRETDLTSAYIPTNSVNYQGDGIWIRTSNGWVSYNKGDVITIKLEGETGTSVGINSYPDYVSVELSSDTFVNGSAVMTITFLEDWVGDFGISKGNSTNATVLKYAQTEEIEATQHIVTFTIPDGKHIAIDYEYLLTNLDGSPIGRGLSLWLENDSVVYTSGGEESSKADEEQFSVSEVTGNISTGGVSKIMKVDVGNYSIKNLEAEFILAKFDKDTGDWIYATEFPFATSVDKDGNTITSTTDHTISYEGAVAESSLGGIIPSTAQAERIKLKGAFNVSFEDNALYKLIELKAPDNYMETGFVEGVSTFDDMLDFTTYFTYIYSDTDVSDEVKASANIPANKQITMLNYLASIEIPNAKPISIGAEKNWEQDPASAVNNPSVTLELWKSYQQISNDVPNASIDMNLGAIKVGNASEYFTEEIKNAENMTTSYGVGNADGTFTLTRQGDSDYVWRADEIWENLPNGENGKPVYYYVKEVAYTIDGVTYKLNAEGRYVSDEGNAYIDGEGNEAEYRPTYSNNALNDDGVVNVTNTRRFVIKKIWMRSDGSIMTNPPDTPIEIKLEGYLESTKSWQELILGSNNIVSAENGWEVEIAQRYLTAYSKFRVTEINPPYNYTISTIYELDGTVGTVKLINKSKSPTQTSLDVTKIWGDDTTHNAITVVLYQANSGIEESALAEMSKGTMPENAEEINLKKVEIEGVQAEVILSNKNSWHYIWNNLPYADELERRLYYYAVETEVPEGYTVTYEKVNSGDQTETITNSIPGALSIDKNWIDTEENPIVVGKGSIELQVYTATVASTTASAPIVETTPASTPSQGDNTETETSTIKIMPVGDSITWGYSYALNGGSVGGYRKYLYHELTKLGYNVDMVGSRVGWDTTDSDEGAMMTHQRSDNTGEFITYDGRHESISGWTIDQIRKDLINKNKAVEKYKPDVVLLMAGTNDVLHNYSGSIIPTSTLYTLYDGLVDDIYSQNDSKDMKVFLLTAIPTTDVSNAETAISNLNEAARQVAKERTEAGYFCKVLDVNSDVYTSDKVATYLDGDGIHPTDDGYEAIGNYLAEQLDSYLKTGEAPPEEDEEEEEEDKLVIEEINDPTDLEANIIMGTLKPVGDPITIEPDEAGNWSTVLKDLPAHAEGDPTTLYVYYIVEKNGDSYDVKYVGNGQLLTEDGTSEISLTNTKAFEPIDITVNKVWPEELPEGVTIPTQITVELYSSTVASDDESDWTLEESTTITNLNWSYTFTDLHGGKFWYVKEIADGWSATYDGNGLTGEDGTITITNTADTGNLSLKKEWYKDNTGGNSSVELKVYRVAYDDNGNPIYEYQPRLNSTSAAFSLSAMRNAFAVANSKETETEIDLSDVQLSLGSGAQVLAVERTKTITTFELVESWTKFYWVDVYSAIGECKITSVSVDCSAGFTLVTDAQYPNTWWSTSYTGSSNVAISFSKEITSSDGYLLIQPWGSEPPVSITITYELAAEPFELGSAPSSLVAGDTGTITATGASSTINWSSSNDAVASVDANGVITAKDVEVETKVTITGQDGDDTSRTVSAEITIKPFQITNGDEVLLKEGVNEETPVQLDTNGNGTITWSTDNDAVSVDENTGKLTLNRYIDTNLEGNTITITAKNNNIATDTITVNVQPAEIQLFVNEANNTSTTLHIDGTATLLPSKTDVTYSVEPEGVVTLEGTTVRAVGEGDATITATRNGKTASVTIKVAQLKVSPSEGTYNINSDITLTLENVVDGIDKVESSNPASVEVVSTSDSTIVLKAIDEGDAVITIIDGAGAEVTATIKVEIQQATVIEPDVDNLDFLWNKTITLGESNNWYGSLADLPLTDGNGHVYTYYVVEELPTGANYYPIYYSDNDGFTLENGELTSITVENKADEVESEDVILPESGGEGTTNYYTFGIIIMLVGAAALIVIKRRQKVER